MAYPNIVYKQCNIQILLINILKIKAAMVLYLRHGGGKIISKPSLVTKGLQGHLGLHKSTFQK